MIRRPRARLTALATAALLTTAAFAGAAAPANAVTFDNEPVRITAHFTVAGHPYTLRDVSVGTATQTVRIGQHSGQYRSHYRLTLKDNTGHVLAKVNRGLYKQDYILTTFSDRTFPTKKAFARAEHRALHVTSATAKNHWLKELRIQSVGADLESNIGVTLDYLAQLPAGTAPNFNAVKSIHSNEYRGNVTISGTDTKHWSVIVRDTQDGYGEFYDNTTSNGTSFHF
ncbi:hypothetical protein GCM10025783_30470 [Amnibacterium soli]|uniref:Tat pathway signal sequence domain protein n=1 Tax=Amnibacterium soli TaxID=1282736 RepID=A0ABP8ZFH6_9MICO